LKRTRTLTLAHNGRDCRFSHLVLETKRARAWVALSQSGEGRVRDYYGAALLFSAAPKNFDAWRRSRAPGAKVPHPALRADLSRQGEVIRAPILQKSTVSECGRGEQKNARSVYPSPAPAGPQAQAGRGRRASLRKQNRSPGEGAGAVQANRPAPRTELFELKKPTPRQR
jgi:hypothetical protein